jgi:hypothetical protein
VPPKGQLVVVGIDCGTGNDCVVGIDCGTGNDCVGATDCGTGNDYRDATDYGAVDGGLRCKGQLPFRRVFWRTGPRSGLAWMRAGRRLRLW